MKDKFLRLIDYASEYSLYGFVIFIPISNAAIESFFGFIFLFFLIKKILKPDFKSLKSYTHLFLLFFIFFMSLSLINSGQFFIKSLKALFFKWIENFLIFIIVQDTLNSSKKVNKCLVILLSISVLIGIDALYQKFLGVDFLHHRGLIPLWGKTMFHGGGITASFEHYNSLGTYLVFALSLVLVSLIAIKNIIYKVALFMLLILLQICLILTFSRSSWLAFLSVIVLLLLLYSKPNKLIYIFAFYFILIFVPGLKERMMLADAGRFEIWKGTFEMIKEHPFLGLGLGTYMDYFHSYIPKTRVLVTQYAHNCFLQIWAESGIFTLLSFILFIGSVFINSVKTFENNKSNFILLGFLCAFFGFLVQAFFDSQLYSLQLSVLFWFMAGVIIALIRLGSDVAS